MSDVINWGVLGASNFALKHMAPALHSALGARLYALATSSADKAAGFQSFQPDLKIHKSYDALLDDANIHAVYVPLPNHLHVDYVHKALDAGKHVLCEKPIAMAASQIDPLIEKRNATGLLAAEGFMIVHHAQWQRARHLVQDGAIGKLIHVDGTFTYNNPDPNNIRNAAGSGGGGIPDIGVYTYGATRWVTGQEPVDITHADITFENGVDTIARVSAQFDGFTAHWVNSMRMHPMQSMTFHGDAGALRLTAPFNPNVFDIAQIELHQPDLGVRLERFPAENHYKNQVEAFCRSITTDAPYPWPLEQAKGTQDMIDRVFAKAKS